MACFWPEQGHAGQSASVAERASSSKAIFACVQAGLKFIAISEGNGAVVLMVECVGNRPGAVKAVVRRLAPGQRLLLHG